MKVIAEIQITVPTSKCSPTPDNVALAISIQVLNGDKVRASTNRKNEDLL
jgi:hypothetical protein